MMDFSCIRLLKLSVNFLNLAIEQQLPSKVRGNAERVKKEA